MPLPALRARPGAALALAAGATFSLSTLASAPARACGGFFCQVVAVDQNAERILFEVNDDQTITTVVEIAYTGKPEGFSWVIPVAETPKLGVVPASALRMLDAGSAPRIIPPEQYGQPDARAPFATSDTALSGAENSDVYVEDLPQVGPFDPEVVSSDDPQALTDWLIEHDYTITPEMEPFVAEYVEQGMKFLAMKLAPGADVADIAPIAMTYAGTIPSIPLVLTGVSAEPEMSFIVFVLGAQRYGASNYPNLLVDDDLLQADPRTGETNYYPLISWQADQVGGMAFFTEYADQASELRSLAQSGGYYDDDYEESVEWIDGTLGRHAYVTRLYTRMSNWEMVEDPLFVPVEGGDVSNVHDLSSHDPVHFDVDVLPAVQCGTTYCGELGRCAVTEIGEGCVCDNGFVGRRIRAPRLGSIGPQDTVACQDGAFDLMRSLLDADPSADPCNAVSCGEGGSCVANGGVASCECGDGYAAVNTGDGIVCSLALETYGPEQILWPGYPSPASCQGCASDGAGRGDARPLAALGLLLGFAALRRRS